MAIITKTDNAKYQQRCTETKHTLLVGTYHINALEKDCHFLIKLKHKLNTFLDICPHKDLSITVHIIIFQNSHTGNNPNVHQLISEKWYSHTMKCHLAIKRKNYGYKKEPQALAKTAIFNLFQLMAHIN